MGVNRRDFMTLAAAGSLMASMSAPASGKVVEDSKKTDVPPRNRRPYSGVDWKNVLRIKTATHGHCTHQGHLDIYLKRGFRFLTVSNYYPSVPWVPLAEMTSGRFRVRQDHAVMVNGKRTKGPFKWNDIIAPWKESIDQKFAHEYPFKEGEKIFKSLPPGVLEAPNAEHHSFLGDDGRLVYNLHMCSPGSLYCSGTFDAKNRFRTASHGYCFGTGEKWRTAIDRMLEELICPEGGGVTINHPLWTKLDRLLLLDLLDHDPRVLGVEVIENGRKGENYWDWVLSTGRQCFGFFVPDWGLWQKRFGVNVLCVHEHTVHACLKAYRQGNFYGAEHGLDELVFTHLSFDGKVVYAATDKPARFEFVTAQGVVKTVKGASAQWNMPLEGDGKGPKVDIFVRVKAYAVDGTGEILYSQPFMLI